MQGIQERTPKKSALVNLIDDKSVLASDLDEERHPFLQKTMRNARVPPVQYHKVRYGGPACRDGNGDHEAVEGPVEQKPQRERDERQGARHLDVAGPR